MDAVETLEVSLESFLPLSKMAEVETSARARYMSAKPFPHVFLDDFFTRSLLEKVLDEFPAPGAINWQRFDNDLEVKLASRAERFFGPVTRLLLYHLNSITFLEFISRVTGIANLIPDPCFDGGGLHQIERGGKLAVHADFNKHPRYGLDRRLNVLLYLNKDWRDEYGGSLELWDRQMTRCETRISPIFNRLLIFATTDFTYHGHPQPLECPQGMTRKSLALYYFTNGRPSEEVSGEHSTLFPKASAVSSGRNFKQQVKRAARDLLPPIISRRLRKFL